MADSIQTQERYYRYSLPGGAVEVTCQSPDGKWPVGEEADDLIEWFGLITKQILRCSRQHAERMAAEQESPPPGAA